jgi:carbon-monoxide dehydrogenase small subunit
VSDAKPITLALTVNGEALRVETLPGARLLDLLRGLGLSGSKEGCGEGECGACSVIMDGRLVNSCLVLAAQAQGAAILTVEGAAGHPVLRRVQEGLAERAGAQCGICTPGMVLAAGALLMRVADPDEEEIRRALAGNLCRCTGYVKIIDGVRQAARALAAPKGSA